MAPVGVANAISETMIILHFLFFYFYSVVFLVFGKQFAQPPLKPLKQVEQNLEKERKIKREMSWEVIAMYACVPVYVCAGLCVFVLGA